MRTSEWRLIVGNVVFVFFCTFIIQTSSTVEKIDEIIKEVEHNVSEIIKELDAAIKKYKNEREDDSVYFTPEEYFAPTCGQCTTVVNMVQFVKTFMSDKRILSYFIKGCRILINYPASACTAGIELFGYDILYAIKNSGMESEHICNHFFDNCPENERDPRHNWTVVIPPRKEAVKKPTLPSEEKPKLKVLHITDVHYDPYYQEGTDADCELHMCCRASTGWATSKDTAAGKWGDYRKCDSPKALIENAFDYISKQHKDIDYIMWTGDIPPHDIWNQTVKGNIDNFKETSKLFDKYFNGKPIYPAVGNHESCPMDSFLSSKNSPPNRNMAYLYNELAEQWKKWLPTEIADTATIKKGAYYSATVKVDPKLRIISLNGNYCGNKNFMLLIDSVDPEDQLAWLVRQLEDAEAKGDKVHILNHIPTGNSDCLKAWSWNYYNIIERFQDTVVAQFHGHTHYDEFKVFYDTKEFRTPVGVAYIAPSITPWKNCNPAYRIYHVDGNHEASTRLVLDHETWYADLGLANKDSGSKPEWKKAYGAKDLYNMPSLLPKDWDDLVNRMDKNLTLFDLYFKTYFRYASPEKCKDDCRRELLCDLRQGRSHDRDNLCRNLLKTLE